MLYKGRASPMYVHGFYPDLEGWDPRPGRSGSRRCMAMIPPRQNGCSRRRGIPRVSKTTLAISIRRRPGNDRGDGSGGPSVARGGHRDRAGRRRLGCCRAPQVAETGSQWVPLGDPLSKKAVEPQLAVFNVGKGIGHIFQTDEIYKMWEDLLQITDAKAGMPSFARSATTSSKTSRDDSLVRRIHRGHRRSQDRQGLALPWLGRGRRRPHVANHGVQTGDALQVMSAIARTPPLKIYHQTLRRLREDGGRPKGPPGSKRRSPPSPGAQAAKEGPLPTRRAGSQAVEKGPYARRRPKAGREA